MTGLPAFVGFDTETTSPDPKAARIVSAAIIDLDERGNVLTQQEWLVDPGVEIPAGATNVHGITTARARAEGTPAAIAVPQILDALYHAHTGDGDPADPHPRRPLIIYNASYDLTLLDRECRRFLGHGMLERYAVEGTITRDDWLGPIIDPFVIDGYIDHRPGKRTLSSVAEFHGVEFDGAAHAAAADAIAAARLGIRMLAYARLSGYTLEQLHESQIVWRRKRAAGLADYFAREGRFEEAETVDHNWPLREVGEEYDPTNERDRLIHERQLRQAFQFDNPYGGAW